MKKGRWSSGYTIVEVMIVLGVSSALLVGGLLLVGNQQKNAEITSSANDIKETVDGVINTVSTGYYKSNNNFTCTQNPAHPMINSVASDLGTNYGCIFLGKAIQFGVHNDLTAINIYSIAGLQYVGGAGGTVVTRNLSQAQPVAIAKSSLNPSAPTSTIEDITIGYGLKILKVKYNGVITTANTIAFVSDFAGLDASGNLNSSSRTASLYAIDTTSTVDDAFAAASKIQFGNFTLPGTVNVATACFTTATDKYVVLTIGKSGRQLSTDMQVRYPTPIPSECT